MGGLWVDYDLQSTLPGLFVLGEANFSDHGANRLGASALMQGLADGYFVLPYTIGGHFAGRALPAVSTDAQDFETAERAVRERTDRILAARGRRSVDSFHRELGQLMWDRCGMARNDAGLRAAIEGVRALREEFWRDVGVPGKAQAFNQNLEHAGRVADFLEFAELLAQDALERTESCGGHFREESQTEEGEALRDDERFSYVAAWEFRPDGQPPVKHEEALAFEHVKPSQRSYK
jgi:succinate dehydrogenase / fumarate reductase flavoprotein subunit